MLLFTLGYSVGQISMLISFALGVSDSNSRIIDLANETTDCPKTDLSFLYFSPFDFLATFRMVTSKRSKRWVKKNLNI